MVSYMSFFNDIPDGSHICSAVKSAMVEEIVSGIRYGIANLRDQKDVCAFGFVLKTRRKEDIERLCRQEIMEIKTELLSKHYLLTIVDGADKYDTGCEKFWVKDGEFLSKDYVYSGDTVFIVEAKEKKSIISMDGLNLSENGNIRL